MRNLTELTQTAHAKLKVKHQAALENAASMHVLNLRVSEVAKTAASLPIFISKHNHDGSRAMSALTSIVPGTNTFVSQGNWQALYQPISVRTYPFYLMKSPKDETSYTIGIFEDSDAFSESMGQELFDESGRASLYLAEQSKLVESSIKEDILTHEFLNEIDAIGLIKSVDLVVQYASGESQVLKGLCTLDEDKIQALEGEQLQKYHQNGYLAAMQGMLSSLFQLNNLVQHNNRVEGMDSIQQIRLETARDRSGA